MSIVASLHSRFLGRQSDEWRQVQSRPVHRQRLHLSRTLLVFFAVAFCAGGRAVEGAETESVRVMSFNLLTGGDGGGQPLERTVAVIRAARADLVGLQETSGVAQPNQKAPDNAAKIAQMLGWHYFDQGDHTGVISRFKIIGHTPRKWGVKLQLPSGKDVYLFNAHLKYTPYQPYQLLRIPYNNTPFLKTEAEAVQAARAARGAEVDRMLAEVRAVLAENTAVFITGDFNEPSHLDWTARAAQAGACPLAVAWPATRAVVEAGFVDAYRHVHRDEVARRGLTWTPTTKLNDPKDRHDRIDFVFARGASVKAAEVVGESREFADVVAVPYPSDHRSVVATVEIGGAVREAWRYTTPQGAAGFVRIRNQRWREMTPQGDLYHFVEVEQAADRVELRDRSRNMRLRLFGDHCEFKYEADAGWRRLYDGSWTTPAQIPAPPPDDYQIRIAYFVPSDRQPVHDYASRIRILMRIVSDIYRTDLEAKGYLPRDLALEDREGRPVVHLVRSARPVSYYNGAPQYEDIPQLQRILADVPTEIADVRRHVLIVFAETYDEKPAPVEWPGTLARGSRTSTRGGFGVFSSWILKDEFSSADLPAQKKLLFDETPIRGRVAMGWGRPDSPRHQFLQDGIGAVAHELGHALGLDHDLRDDDRDVMANGFRRLSRNYRPDTAAERRVGFSTDNARLLMCSRYLGTNLDFFDEILPVAELVLPSELKAGETDLKITLKASDDADLRAAVIFDPQSGSVIWGAKLQGADVTIDVPIKLKALKAGEFRLDASVADSGGNLTRTSVTGKVSEP